MHHELRVFDDVDALASAAADYVTTYARETLLSSSNFTFAVSGGKSPWLMLEHLAQEEVDWSRSTIYQVDERVVGVEDDGRNLKHVRECLGATHVAIEAMDVDDQNLDAACGRYASLLPSSIDLVHLGLGPDGHCASLLPNDPVLEVTDRLVALAGPYQGAKRMTITFPVLQSARQLLWLVSGEDKRDALQLLLASDPSIPAGRVEAASSLVMVERAAMKP